jgi:voltage-gated potassium channel Kch
VGGYVLRYGLLLLVFAAGFVGLSSGVVLSERDLADANAFAYAYYTLSLFVIGGVDLGTPVSGPTYGLVCLWTAYFMAPAITASALVEAALRLIDPRLRRLRRLHDHVIVCGAGRLSLLYIKKLRELDTRVGLVVIERDTRHTRLRELENVYRAEIVHGDPTSERVLEAAGIDRAARVLLLTDDDFANLDAAARILARAPALRGNVIAHVADLAFLHAVPAETIEAGLLTFNSLESAAMCLVENHLVARFAQTEHRDLVVLAGFGRFGQTVLMQLQKLASEAFGTVVIIDDEAEVNALRFADSPGFGEHPRHVITGNLRHPNVWKQLDACIAADGGAPVIVVGTGDEGTNLHAALDFRRRYPSAHITVRSFMHSPFAKDVADKAGLQWFELAELISDRMPSSWF